MSLVFCSAAISACGSSENVDTSSSNSQTKEDNSSVPDNSSNNDNSSDEHEHALIHKDAKAANCTEDGNIEYWTCASCGKLYADEACTMEISQEQTVVEATGHSWKLDAADASVYKLVCDYGFKGTLDGRGYTINGVVFNGCGLFGAKVGGAIKNLNFTNAKYQVSGTNSIFGANMKDVLVENITITFVENNFTAAEGGLLCAQQTYGCTFKNITVNANGSAINTLIGTAQYSGGNTNTFENVVVNAKSMKYVVYTLETANGVTLNEK